MTPQTAVVKFASWSVYWLVQPLAKKIYAAAAIGAGAVIGEVAARKLVPKTVAKIEGGIEAGKQSVQTGVVLMQHVVIPAAKAKAQSLFSRKAKGEATPVAAKPSQAPSPKVTVIEMEQFPPHAVAPGIPVEDLV